MRSKHPTSRHNSRLDNEDQYNYDPNMPINAQNRSYFHLSIRDDSVMNP